MSLGMVDKIPLVVNYLRKRLGEDFTVLGMCKELGVNKATYIRTIRPLLEAEPPKGFGMVMKMRGDRRGYKLVSLGIISKDSYAHSNEAEESNSISET